MIVEGWKEFPSPFGVQFFLMHTKKQLRLNSKKFPSPFGVQFFLTDKYLLFKKCCFYVSVSFRSSILFNATLDLPIDPNLGFVSVSFRSSILFNAYEKAIKIKLKKVSVSFRSSILFYTSPN